MDSATIRERFIAFFESKGHTRIPSAPLILKDDPSVLFTSAGMQPLVPYFLGRKQAPAKRIVTIQKCVRTTDIDQVGTDSYHQSFFEMLGNFSLGDYWKKEAIALGWGFLTTELGFNPDALVATIHTSDDEAYGIWTEELALLPAAKVFRLGDEHNFWSPGPTGLCGPDSEVFFDRGPQPGAGPHECNPGEHCGRYIEIWNFVFQQYDRKEDGSLVTLTKKNIDTGAGLERITQVLQGVPGDTYRTDLFQPLVQRIAATSGASYGEDPAADKSIRIVAEHTRTATFLITDGVAPSNEWRGYVLRRLLRRAALHARRLGLPVGSLSALSGDVVTTMQRHYHELTGARGRIAETIRLEEEKFERTLASGSERLNGAIAAAKAAGRPSIDGETVFALYDTFGFPLEMTKELAGAAGLAIDQRGFDALLDGQRQRSRATAKFNQDALRFGQFYAELKERQGLGSTFTGYDSLSEETVVRSLAVNGEPAAEAREGAEIEIVLERTPFYPEGGGQVGDRGEITTAEGRAMVADTQTAAPGVIVMVAKVTDGAIRLGAAAKAMVDERLRRDTMRNHTGTHLLHAALRRVLGDDVHQAGSLVHAPNLRFDFTFGRAMTQDELRRVEDEVNAAILDNCPVEARTMPLETALATGAAALFDEKYADEVRVVEACSSRELCGGTHCHHTGDIGMLLIVKEESVGAGIRRIEALTGGGALQEVREVRERLAKASAALRVPAQRVPDAVAQLQEQRDKLDKELTAVRRAGIDAQAKELARTAQDVGGVKIVTASAGAADLDHLRALGDRIRDLLDGGGVVVLAGTRDDRASLVVTVSKDLAKRVSADAAVKALAPLMGGRGGGKPDSASAGGGDPKRIADVLAEAVRVVRDKLNGSGG